MHDYPLGQEARWLQPTFFLNFDVPAVRDFAEQRSICATGQKAKAVALYYAVRDEFRYDPYRLDYSPAGFSASRVLENGYGFCLPKANLLAAAARAIGIPAGLGYGDVQNHLTSEKLRQNMDGQSLFLYHGYAQLWIEGRWVKATPAFNKDMCDRFGVKPLEFDGSTDSLFHEYDTSGRHHMEYVRDHGVFDDVPFDRIIATWRKAYPKLFVISEGEQTAIPDEFSPIA